MRLPPLPEVAGALLAAAPANPLGPGVAAGPAAECLGRLTLPELFAPAGVVDRTMAECCRAGLWLRMNHLAASHAVSQGLEGATAAYWHGLMHRREPDAANAAYWMRRVGQHSIHKALHAAARGLVQAGGMDSRAEYLLHQDRWNALSFIDLCETYRGTGSRTERFCEALQAVEWELLFAYCWQKATGAGEKENDE